MSNNGSSTTRLLEIDRAKGLGIALVVWGHLAGQTSVALPIWFYISVATIYDFHMPFFMYLSGFVFFLTDSPGRFLKAPRKFVVRRFDRLMVPFLALGILVVMGKYFVSRFAPVDDPVNNVAAGLWSVFTNGPDNPNLSIWYLLVLFTYSIITPVLCNACGGRMWILFIISALLWIPTLPENFYIHRLAIYYIFFITGGVVALNRDRIIAIFSRFWPLSLLTLAAFCWIFTGQSVALLLCGLASIPALHGIFLGSVWARDRVFLDLGRSSMAIYLLNTIVIGLMKFLWWRSLSLQAAGAIAFLSATFAAALLVPMLVRRLALAFPSMHPLARYLG
jgi:fucose 4-O-acetylase-like acetyltransferase